MSAAAFNFLSNNIAPKWLADKLADGGGGGGNEWSDDPCKHRLSLNDDRGYGYGSTYNGSINRTLYGSHNNNSLHPRGDPPGYNDADRGYNNAGHNFGGKPMTAYYEPNAPSSPEQPRHRRLSSPDPVLTHCANTIAVADFLMTLQRSLDRSASVTMQSTSSLFYNNNNINNNDDGNNNNNNNNSHSNRASSSVTSCAALRPERRSPLFTMFQDRRPSSSAESWQYSSLASTVSSSTTTTTADAAVAFPADKPQMPTSTVVQLLQPAVADTKRSVTTNVYLFLVYEFFTSKLALKKKKKKRKYQLHISQQKKSSESRRLFFFYRFVSAKEK